MSFQSVVFSAAGALLMWSFWMIVKGVHDGSGWAPLLGTLIGTASLIVFVNLAIEKAR
jgi:hypothetical protein